MVVGGAGEIMAGRGQSWLLVAKFWFAVRGCGWLWVVQSKLWLVVDGRGWSFNIAYFYGKSKKLHNFLNSECVTREREREREHFIFKEK